MAKFKVGDRVRILDGTEQKGWLFDGGMKKYIGTIGTVGMTCRNQFNVKLDSDKSAWTFNEEDLEKVDAMEKIKEFTKSDLQEFDEVVYRNSEKNIYYQGKFRGDFSRDIYYYNNDLTRDDEQDEFDIMQVIRNKEVIWERVEKSPIQIELESLEQQQREIADKIAELSKKV